MDIDRSGRAAAIGAGTGQGRKEGGDVWYEEGRVDVRWVKEGPGEVAVLRVTRASGNVRIDRG